MKKSSSKTGSKTASSKPATKTALKPRKATARKTKAQKPTKAVKATGTAKEKPEATVPVLSPEGDISYRVWKLSEMDKEAVKEARGETTVKDFVAGAILGQLPELVRLLEAACVTVDDSKIGPVRYPMLESSLKALRYASNITGMDQQALLVACLRLASRKAVK